MAKNIDLSGLSPLMLRTIAEHACYRLTAIANMLTTDEGNEDDTEDEYGLDVSEVVGMAHDNMIHGARVTLETIVGAIKENQPTTTDQSREA